MSMLGNYQYNITIRDELFLKQLKFHFIHFTLVSLQFFVGFITMGLPSVMVNLAEEVPNEKQ
jgi:hypothetical protein